MRLIRIVLPSELAPADYRNAQRTNCPRHHHLKIRFHTCLCGSSGADLLGPARNAARFHVNQTGSGNSWQSRNSLRNLAEMFCPIEVLISPRNRKKVRHQQAAGAVARIHITQLVQASQKKPRSRQQHDRERHLGHDKAFSKASRARSESLHVVLERGNGIRSASAPSGDQAEYHSR